jgi:hypothetical protein
MAGMNARVRRLAATSLALGWAACGGAPAGPKTAPDLRASDGASVDDPAFDLVRNDPALASIAWSKHVMGTLDVFVSPVLLSDPAESARIAARRHYEESGLYPILTPFSLVPDTAEEWAKHRQQVDDAPAPFVLSQYLNERSKRLADRPHGKAMKAELPTAVPVGGYVEGREYLHPKGSEPPEKLALWLVRGRPWEAATVLTEPNVGNVPLWGDLPGMLKRWNAQWGAEAVYVNGRFFLEMTTTKQPPDDASLRAFAWEFFLTCPSDREAIDQEPAARLLGRLKKDRWVCWWFVE